MLVGRSLCRYVHVHALCGGGGARSHHLFEDRGRMNREGRRTDPDHAVTSFASFPPLPAPRWHSAAPPQLRHPLSDPPLSLRLIDRYRLAAFVLHVLSPAHHCVGLLPPPTSPPQIDNPLVSAPSAAAAKGQFRPIRPVVTRRDIHVKAHPVSFQSPV